jgi:hypothetical protein
MDGLSDYWKHRGKTTKDKRPGRTFDSTNGPMCAECCNGDRCDDPSHFSRSSCPFCLGTGRNSTTKAALDAAGGEDHG